MNEVYLLIITAPFLIYFYCRYKLNYWTRRGVDQFNNTDLIFGDYKDGILFRTAPGFHSNTLYRQAPQNLPYIGFYIFHKPCLLIRDPEMAKKIFVRDSDNFSDRHFAGTAQMDSFGMINLFGMRNPAWKYVRGKITPSLSCERTNKMIPMMLESVECLVQHFEKCIGDGSRVFDVQDCSDRVAADLISNIALGVKTDSFKEPNTDYTKSLISFFRGLRRKVALVTVFFMPELVRVFGSLILFDSSVFRKIFWSTFKSREKSGNTRGDYIDTIMQLRNGAQNPVYKFEGENLLFQTGIFFSGFESSSITTTFTLMHLAKNREYQRRARDEVKYAIGRYGWTADGFNEMKFIDQCIEETLRMYPPVMELDRLALKDYKLPGTDLIIEKGTPVFVSIGGLQNDPVYFNEPDVFKPERFNKTEAVSPAYLPFGCGPRKCIGIKAGYLAVKIMLAKILLKYEMFQESNELNRLDPTSTFTAAAGGIKVEFKKIIE